jgi:hypothetical protein
MIQKIGFLILIVALVGDWHFQSAINEEQTDELVSAQNRIVALSPRYWLMGAGGERIVSALKPFARQRVVIFNCENIDPIEPMTAAMGLATCLREAEWTNAWGQPMTGSEPADRLMFRVVDPTVGRCSQGIFIEVQPTAPSRTRRAAKALATALNQENIAAMDFDRLNWPYPPDLPTVNDVIVVSIGFKGL